MSKIKYIINIISSKPDTYGNRYSATTVTHTGTGKSFIIDNGWGDGSNSLYIIQDMGKCDWSRLSHNTNEVGKREYNALSSRADCGEHEKDIIRSLLRKIALKK